MAPHFLQGCLSCFASLDRVLTAQRSKTRMMRLTLHRNELVRGAITFFRPQGVESLVQKHRALEVEAIV